jgi:hypothetical protein
MPYDNTGDKYHAGSGVLSLEEVPAAAVQVAHFAGADIAHTAVDVDASEQGSDYSDGLVGQKTMELTVTIWRGKGSPLLVPGDFNLALEYDDTTPTPGNFSGEFRCTSVGTPFRLGNAVAYNARFVNNGDVTFQEASGV